MLRKRSVLPDMIDGVRRVDLGLLSYNADALERIEVLELQHRLGWPGCRFGCKLSYTMRYSWMGFEERGPMGGSEGLWLVRI